MKNKSVSQSAFFYVRTSLGLLFVLSGVFLALLGVGQFPAQAQRGNTAGTGISPLVPPGFDCAQIPSLGIHIQENLRAGAIMIACGEAQGGALDPDGPSSGSLTQQIIREISAPLLGGADVDLITGADTSPHVTQSETFAAANPDNPNEIVVAFNDSRGVFASPINISGASVSTDGGATFTRLTKSGGQSPFTNTFGDPVALYNKPTGTWFAIWLDAACGSQGLGFYKSTNASDPNSWTHGCIHNGGGDDRESGYADNSTTSPFFGRMYVSWNDFNRGGGALFVRFSTDNGLTWSNERQLTTGFIRDVQITGDPSTGAVYVAGMDEAGGGLTTRRNKIFKSTDGGVTWTNTYTGPSFDAPGRRLCPNSYFACMFQSGRSGYWRHMGWGQPAAFNGVVHYIYDSRNTVNSDPADVFYIRSTDGGVTFSAPFKLNTDSTTRAQWQPNISVAADGSLLAVWYDERETTACTKGDQTVPCYRMWARRSADGGLTWAPDEPFSDVISPLPGQPDSGIIAEYAGDYDYSNSVGNTHIHPWTDGRVAVNSAAQQDAFVDREPASGGGGGIVLQARARTQGSDNIVVLRWSPADGGNVNVLRNGVIVQTTPDDGGTRDNLGTMTGMFTYQVCETDTNDCSNEVPVTVP